MSLSVLKRKSQTTYSKISSSRTTRNQAIFSLNNPRRVYSKSGRGRVQSQTPMKGVAYKGHGTKGTNTYSRNIVKSQYTNDDPHVIDNSNGGNTSISVKNHTGSIQTRFKWMKRGYPYFITKDTSPLSYADRNKVIAAQHAATSMGQENYKKTCTDQNNCTNVYYNYVKNVEILDQSEYLKTKFLAKNCLPTINEKAPFPRPLNANCRGCGNGDSIDYSLETEKGACH